MGIFSEIGIMDRKEDVSESVVYNIGRTYGSLVKYFDRELSEFGLNTTKFNTLMIVKHSGNAAGLKQNEIRSKLFVSEANITKLIDNLEKNELVDRCAKPGDRRANIIKITKKGSDLLDKVWIRHIQMIKKLTNDMSTKDKQLVSQLLSKIRDNLV
jgi:DNA-binding MarR family transcriptional regulator